jgi:hypothetical protein
LYCNGDSYFIAADNGILYVSSKNGCIIHDRLPSEATLMFFLVACHIAKGGLLNVIEKKSIV